MTDTSPTWPDLLTALLAGTDLSADDTRWAMGEVMRGEATPVQLAGFLVALKAKGLTTEELTGLADEMLSHAHRIEVPGVTVEARADVLPAPRVAITEGNGEYRLPALPPGNYTLHAQFDEKAKWSTPVTISAGKTATADFSKPASVP